MKGPKKLTQNEKDILLNEIRKMRDALWKKQNGIFKKNNLSIAIAMTRRYKEAV
ncbi:hypothetical protein G3R47_04350 [Acinetobacter baumannii]|uniref:hypothetical protein n=1 Tax=Acinetobacter baumannii TaxID=470 RepID=UPI00146489A6|nr:hypothetical protein [Acinetobacter baumannii]QJP36795.1 hypothetical protein G3R47_04350 [Acinetobacter baumannii]HAV4524138.1 hypothetical protein [Acinetobacter baumannii]HCW4615916.1 hypothetical protein [Acinetobacter baumannii]HEE5879725.1 hypothetical protein [Acinetobacter baumannii]